MMEVASVGAKMGSERRGLVSAGSSRSIGGVSVGVLVESGGSIFPAVVLPNGKA